MLYFNNLQGKGISEAAQLYPILNIAEEIDIRLASNLRNLSFDKKKQTYSCQADLKVLIGPNQFSENYVFNKRKTSPSGHAINDDYEDFEGHKFGKKFYNDYLSDYSSQIIDFYNVTTHFSAVLGGNGKNLDF